MSIASFKVLPIHMEDWGKPLGTLDKAASNPLKADPIHLYTHHWHFLKQEDNRGQSVILSQKLTIFFAENTCLLSGAAMTFTNTGIPFAGFSNANGVWPACLAVCIAFVLIGSMITPAEEPWNKSIHNRQIKYIED